MTRDVNAIANLHPLAGVLSNLGILLWCVAASIPLFAAAVIRNAAPKNKVWFLFFSALLSGYLLFDDFFMFHEDLAYRYFGIDEIVVYAGIAISALIYFVAFRRTILLQTRFGVLVLALGFLATSVILDVFEVWLIERIGVGTQFFLEDGAKWLGIASWCSYYVQTSYQFITSTFGLSDDIT